MLDKGGVEEFEESWGWATESEMAKNFSFDLASHSDAHLTFWDEIITNLAPIENVTDLSVRDIENNRCRGDPRRVAWTPGIGISINGVFLAKSQSSKGALSQAVVTFIWQGLM